MGARDHGSFRWRGPFVGALTPGQVGRKSAEKEPKPWVIQEKGATRYLPLSPSDTTDPRQRENFSRGRCELLTHMTGVKNWYGGTLSLYRRRGMFSCSQAVRRTLSLHRAPRTTGRGRAGRGGGPGEIEGRITRIDVLYGSSSWIGFPTTAQVIFKADWR